ncbi:MAG TPA: fumarylacetoacetase [Jatrophihabitantaceae bacterium]|nr:fumarylacetoacetase [Jatrophihabitantaceae bacterium]
MTSLPPDHPFGIHNLPYGVATIGADPRRRVVVRIGEHALDLSTAAGRLRPEYAGLFQGGTLNPLLAAGHTAWSAVREQLTDWLREPPPELGPLLHPLSKLRNHLPFEVADYVDFYASPHHAANVGRLLRPDQPALPANWKHLPAGYHGRAGTVVVSGTNIRRPSGQARDAEGSVIFGPSRRLDIEAEIGFVVGGPTRLGQPVPLAGAAEHIFGICLVNDWSARDIQAWEYVPLGPFLGKSFATSISPWIVPLAALDPARVPPPARDEPLLPYLDDSTATPWGLDIAMTVSINDTVVSRPPFATMYWTAAQQLAHLTVNGASLRAGDLFASGTVSGPDAGQQGCLLELTGNGAQPLTLADATVRSFLLDGDVVTISGHAIGGTHPPIGLGEVTGRIVPA